MHINIERHAAQPPGTGSLWIPPKKHAMRPHIHTYQTEVTQTYKCDSTRSPLSARHGRPTSKRRIWHASRTKRSVSNIIGSVPNGKRRWGGGHRFIPLDHPHPGRMPVRLEGKNQALLQARSSGPRAPSSGPRAGLKPPQDSSSPSPGASRGA